MSLRLRAAAALVAAAALPAPIAWAQDVKAGARKALACQACHGLDGIARLPGAPHLAGQPAAYLELALRAYRSGERRDEVMAIAAKSLGDDDIRDLAAYFAAIQIEIKSLPK
jgi:cytochrome c553